MSSGPSAWNEKPRSAWSSCIDDTPISITTPSTGRQAARVELALPSRRTALRSASADRLAANQRLAALDRSGVAVEGGHGGAARRGSLAYSRRRRTWRRHGARRGWWRARRSPRRGARGCGGWACSQRRPFSCSDTAQVFANAGIGVVVGEQRLGVPDFEMSRACRRRRRVCRSSPSSVQKAGIRTKRPLSSNGDLLDAAEGAALGARIGVARRDRRRVASLRSSAVVFLLRTSRDHGRMRHGSSGWSRRRRSARTSVLAIDGVAERWRGWRRGSCQSTSCNADPGIDAPSRHARTPNTHVFPVSGSGLRRSSSRLSITR